MTNLILKMTLTLGPARDGAVIVLQNPYQIKWKKKIDQLILLL